MQLTKLVKKSQETLYNFDPAAFFVSETDDRMGSQSMMVNKYGRGVSRGERSRSK